MSLKYAALAAIATLTIAACGTATADEPEAASTPTSTPVETAVLPSWTELYDEDPDAMCARGKGSEIADEVAAEGYDTVGITGMTKKCADREAAAEAEAAAAAAAADRDGDGVPNEEDYDPDNPDVQAAPERPAKEEHRALSERDWALIAKDPGTHASEKVILYGSVTQFDAATGTDTFLARTSGTQFWESYEFDENTMLSAWQFDESLFADVVEDDLVKVYATVLSDFSYDTQIGGNTTVPWLVVNHIEVYGYDG